MKEPMWFIGVKTQWPEQETSSFCIELTEEQVRYSVEMYKTHPYMTEIVIGPIAERFGPYQEPETPPPWR